MEGLHHGCFHVNFLKTSSIAKLDVILVWLLQEIVLSTLTLVRFYPQTIKITTKYKGLKGQSVTG